MDLVMHMCIRGCEINPSKIQRPLTSLKFLRVQWSESYRDSLSKVKGNLLHLAFPTTKKEAQYLLFLFAFWKQNIPDLDVLIQSVNQVTQKVSSFVWGLE